MHPAVKAFSLAFPFAQYRISVKPDFLYVGHVGQMQSLTFWGLSGTGFPICFTVFMFAAVLVRICDWRKPTTLATICYF